MSQENNWEKDFEDFCSKNTVKLAGYGDHFAITKNSIKTFVSKTLETERLRIEKEVKEIGNSGMIQEGILRTMHPSLNYAQVKSLCRSISGFLWQEQEDTKKRVLSIIRLKI